MNNEMMYALFLNSIKKMNAQELKTAMQKAKGFLSESDYTKLCEIIEKERNK